MVQTAKLEIRRNDETALPRFAALNAQWIEELHYLEDSDLKMIAHPEIYTQNGNNVFSAHIDDIVVGACALKQDNAGNWELTKMAVDLQYRSYGIGQSLIEAIETYARETLGLTRIYLLSNTVNAAAIRLYKRNGWIINHEGPHPVYDRCNIGMEKYL